MILPVRGCKDTPTWFIRCSAPFPFLRRCAVARCIHKCSKLRIGYGSSVNQVSVQVNAMNRLLEFAAAFTAHQKTASRDQHHIFDRYDVAIWHWLSIQIHHYSSLSVSLILQTRGAQARGLNYLASSCQGFLSSTR